MSKNQFYVGFSWPVPVSSGFMTGWVSSPCYAALMLMRFCGSAPVCLCRFCPADASCRWLLIYFGVLPVLWFRNLFLGHCKHVHGLCCGAHFIIREVFHKVCKGQQQHVAAKNILGAHEDTYVGVKGVITNLINQLQVVASPEAHHKSCTRRTCRDACCHLRQVAQTRWTISSKTLTSEFQSSSLQRRLDDSIDKGSWETLKLRHLLSTPQVHLATPPTRHTRTTVRYTCAPFGERAVGGSFTRPEF